jgi:hypothetical protein
LHDLDDSGIVIADTIATGSRRYRVSGGNAADIGLRGGDIDGMETEGFTCRVGADALRRHGATSFEIDFLMGGSRVELNAMTSEEFIEFVERKLQEYGIKKVIPDKKILDDAYCAFARSEIAREAVEKAIDGFNVALAPWHSRMPPAAAIEAPADLGARVRGYLDANPENPWEDAVRHVVEEIEQR